MASFNKLLKIVQCCSVLRGFCEIHFMITGVLDYGRIRPQPILDMLEPYLTLHDLCWTYLVLSYS